MRKLKKKKTKFQTQKNKKKFVTQYDEYHKRNKNWIIENNYKY